MPSRSKRLARELASCAVAAAVVLLARASFADQYVVPSGSMTPSVRVGDRVLVDKRAFGLRVPLTERYLARFDAPARGDVVVLDSPVADLVLLKRVVATPGDRVAVERGRLTINGRALTYEPRGGELVEGIEGHPHAVAIDADGGRDFGPVTVPAGRYLVLGDNRGQSHDGRYFGFVRRDAILGRAVAVFVRDGAPAWRPL
jgi:signal peptidase I